MPEIGSTLRDARVHQGLDIADLESSTKIRAKYLRALEEEEWDLLPGSTYVKTFLRTYAEHLGLDAKLLVEEYKLRHERLSDIELQPIAPRSVGSARRRPRGPRVPRGLLVLAVLACLVGLLYVLGRDDDDDRAANTIVPPTGTADTRERPQPTTERRETPRRTSRRVALRIVPTGPIYVCLKGGGRTFYNGEVLAQGSRQPTRRARRFLLRVGNGEARLIINGRSRRLPNGDVAGYEITRARGLRRIPQARWPTCSA